MKLSTLEIIFDKLNSANVRYLVAGGIAVNVHGYPRMTADLDIVIQMDTDNIRNAMNSLGHLGYTPLIPVSADDFADADTRNTWVETKNMQVLSLQSDQYPETTVDIFATEPFDFNHEYKTSIMAELTPDIQFNLLSIETLIKMKQKAGRPRDLDDIQHLQLILDEQGTDND